MKKRIMLMSAIVALAAGAAFASKSQSGSAPIYQDESGCPQISTCTATAGTPVCTVASEGFANSNCTSLVPAYKR